MKNKYFKFLIPLSLLLLSILSKYTSENSTISVMLFLSFIGSVIIEIYEYKNNK